MTEKLKLKGWHVMIIVPSGIGGGLLGWMAAGWGGMIGSGVSGVLGGCLGCFLLEWSLKVQRAKKNKSNVGV
ncbi:MAG: hypothetical protein V3T53_07140 [Phycisphaerales bacterium]